MFLTICINNHTNILKIADFGVSEEIEQSEANISRWAGTPAFVAPETLCKCNVLCKGL